MSGYYRDSRTERERYLEDEFSRMRDDENRRQEEEYQRREERRREQKERWEAENRTASTWPEALRKQAHLFGREANEAGEYDTDNYFADGALACERGLEIWKEVEAAKQEAIAELERQIKAVKASIRVEVAEKLEAESQGRQGWKSVARSIADIDEDEAGRWLDW